MKTAIKSFAIVLIACLMAGGLTGCRAVTVENYGEEIARDADEKPVTLADGRIQTVKKGWKVHHNQHWMQTKADSIEAHIKPEDISFAMNGLNAEPSPELRQLVDTSFQGAANLTTKIAAAIASGGTSATVESIATTAATVYKEYKSAGGTDESAKVAANDSTVIVTGTDSAGKAVTVTENTSAK